MQRISCVSLLVNKVYVFPQLLLQVLPVLFQFLMAGELLLAVVVFAAHPLAVYFDDFLQLYDHCKLLLSCSWWHSRQRIITLSLSHTSSALPVSSASLTLIMCAQSSGIPAALPHRRHEIYPSSTIVCITTSALFWRFFRSTWARVYLFPSDVLYVFIIPASKYIYTQCGPPQSA